MYNPDVIATLQSAVMTGDYEQYRQFAALVNERPVSCIRDLLKLQAAARRRFRSRRSSRSTAILARFDSAGMSLGALSPEAHEALAIAMNRLGARSNSGEGGEDPARYGTEKNSKIKQVASGRFGVTPEYLINAEVLQIKIAQGAKPGEGGQLPGHKVNEMIARLRFARPGRRLDFAAAASRHLLDRGSGAADLRPEAGQPAGAGVGEAGGRARRRHGGGRRRQGLRRPHHDLAATTAAPGASPLSSIKYAGTPWELGLAETHQTLRANELRHRVRLQTDGGLKTGLDVIKAAIIGAESFGFGTAPMVALGCKYLRICHLNNCATGVATQHNVLRAKYLHRPAGDGHELFPVRGAGVPRDHGGARRAQHRRADRPHRASRDPAGRDLEAAQARPEAAAGELPAWCRTRRSSASIRATRPSTRARSASRCSTTCGTAIETKSGGECRYRGRATSTARSARACRARSPGAGATTA